MVEEQEIEQKNKPVKPEEITPMTPYNDIEPYARYMHLQVMHEFFFRLEDETFVSVAAATPEQFDTFISEYLTIKNVNRDLWLAVSRWRAVNFCYQRKIDLRLYRRVETVKNP